MKRIITLIFCVLLIFSLPCAIFAQSNEVGEIAESEGPESKTESGEETEEKEELSVYIKEKIAPIVVGVATSVIALLGAIGSIRKALFSLKDTKEVLMLAQSTFNDELEKIRNEIKGVPELKDKFENLSEDISSITEELKTIMEILALAYSSDEKLVKCGKASKMYKLLGMNVSVGDEETN